MNFSRFYYFWFLLMFCTYIYLLWSIPMCICFSFNFDFPQHQLNYMVKFLFFIDIIIGGMTTFKIKYNIFYKLTKFYYQWPILHIEKTHPDPLYKHKLYIWFHRFLAFWDPFLPIISKRNHGECLSRIKIVEILQNQGSNQFHCQKHFKIIQLHEDCFPHFPLYLSKSPSCLHNVSDLFIWVELRWYR